jgi:hypothetical protein
MNETDFETLARAQARLLGFPLKESHVAATARNLKLIAELSASVMTFPLPDDTEPAPVFTPDPR